MRREAARPIERMSYAALSAMVLMLAPLGAQPIFRAELNPDSVWMDNLFEVRFVLDGAASCEEFVPPPFVDFDVVRGPNLATSIQMINGQVRQQQVWSYVLAPRSEGVYYLGTASVRCGEQVFETDPIEVWVLPNPEGIGRPLPSERPFGEGWPSDDFFFEWRMPSNPFEGFEEFFRRIEPPVWKPAPPADSLSVPRRPPSFPPRKKRKVYRI